MSSYYKDTHNLIKVLKSSRTHFPLNLNKILYFIENECKSGIVLLKNYCWQILRLTVSSNSNVKCLIMVNY